MLALRTLLIATLWLAALFGCSSQPPIEIKTPEQAEAARGKTVIFRGTAIPAIPGASVQNETLLLYCLNVLHWDGHVANHPITVQGKLERTDEFASSDPRARTIGAPLYVIRECQVEDGEPATN